MFTNRHGAATLAHTAGADLKTIQHQLGHATIRITADTYTTSLPATEHKAAEATVRLILKAGKPGAEMRQPAGRRDTAGRHPATAETKPAIDTRAAQRRSKMKNQAAPRGRSWRARESE
ncbi:hypothetical protein B0E53_01164 [Micromonospora sp. MH33]|uniref:hypothetical protein n=1 Tax=Micromonospora sp. MH33 TaxID=1945509 RepID=UPI000D28F567|nr:hypothetical protein [Micromonospora sp. MH33]PSK66829.1 hypothetical protein B0E53_01164 [Micromonospora sp. MH33]